MIEPRPHDRPRSTTGRLITFTNLFPSATFPVLGTFVEDRMRRVAALSGLDWTVVAPVPRVPWPLRRGDYAKFAAMPAAEERDGVPIHHPAYLHLPGISTTRQARRMAAAALPVVRELARERPCVLDAHYVYPDGVAALSIARELGIPCTVTARGTDLNVLADLPRVARQIRDAAASAFALLAVSRPLCEKFAQAAGLPLERVELVRNGVDLDAFPLGDAAAARRRLGLPAEGKLILGVGRLVPPKGFADAAAALDEIPEARLVLVGDGPERARLAASRSGRVICLGPRPREEVAVAYQACDVLALPTEREGWPNVVTEALAGGLPVVATAVGAIPEILTDRRIGAVVSVHDRVALANAIRRFLESPPPRAAVRAFASQFSWEPTIRRLAQIFERALASQEAVAARA